jgi:hypothetical protein
MRIDNSGNVGIGTDSPGDQLHIRKQATTATDPFPLIRLEVRDITNDQELGKGAGPCIDFYIPEQGISEHGGRIAVVKNDGGDDTAHARMAFHTTPNDTSISSSTERMTIDENGLVGIGTATPGDQLHVLTSAVSGADYNAVDVIALERDDHSALNVISGTSSTGAVYFSDDTRAQGRVEYDHSSNKLGLGSTSSSQVVIDSSGNVGINSSGGTIAPEAMLHVKGNVQLILEDNADDFGLGDAWRLHTDSSGTLQFHAHATCDFSSTTALVAFKQDGSIGIGSTKPTYELHVSAASGGELAVGRDGDGTITHDEMLGHIYFAGTTDSGTNWDVGAGIACAAAENWTVGSAAGGDLLFYTTDNTTTILDERMRILDDGRIGIGVTDPDTKLEVLASTTNQLKLSFDATDNCTFGVDTSGHLTITPSGSKILIADDDSLGSSSFASGFAGNGWIVDDGTTADATFDNINVRDTLSVYEMLIQQIRATNGSILISSCAKVESSSGLSDSDDDGTITFEDPVANLCPFLDNDIIMCQRVKPGALVAGDAAQGGDVILKMVYKVASVTNNVCTVENIGFNNNVSAGPVAGDEFVRIGNTGTSDAEVKRQNVMYLTSDDTDAPFIDMKADIDSYADWYAEGSTKLRLGRLDGLTSGGTNEYGLWAGPNATNYIKASNTGVFIKGDENTYLSAGANKLEFYDGYKKMDITGGNITMYTDAEADVVASQWDNTSMTLGGAIAATDNCVAISASGGVKAYGSDQYNFVHVDSDGVTIQADANDKVVVGTSGMTVYNGSNGDSGVVASYGANTTITGGTITIQGTTDTIGDERVVIEDNSISMYTANAEVFDVTGGAVTIGEVDTNSENITIDPTNGIRLRNDEDVMAQMSSTSLALGGTTLADTDCIQIGSNGVRVYGSASTNFVYVDNAAVTIQSSGDDTCVIDSSGMTIKTGGSADANKAAEFLDTGVIIYGDDDATYAQMTSAGLTIFNDGTVADPGTGVAHYGTTARVGAHAADKTAFRVASDGTASIGTSGTAKITMSTAGVLTVADILLTGKISLTGGGSKNICLGTGQTDAGTDNIAIGVDAGSSFASNNIQNVAIGSNALDSAGAGSLLQGSNNIGIGWQSLKGVTTGLANIGIGLSTGGSSQQEGSGSIYIGANAVTQGSNRDNEIVIGNSTTGSGSNTVTIGNASITNTYLNGNLNLRSDDTAIANGNTVGEINFFAKDSDQSVYSEGAIIRAIAEAAWDSANTNDAPTGLTFWTCDETGTAVSERMRIDKDGNVGIGDTSPSSKLTISDNSAYSHFGSGNSDTAEPWLGTFNHADVASATYGWGFFNRATDGDLYLLRYDNSTTGTTQMAFGRSSGNVGIGTHIPEDTLHVAGAYGAVNLSSQNGIAFFEKADNVGLEIGMDNASPWGMWMQSKKESAGESFPLILNPLGGNVGIGYDNPDSALLVSDGGVSKYCLHTYSQDVENPRGIRINFPLSEQSDLGSTDHAMYFSCSDGAGGLDTRFIMRSDGDLDNANGTYGSTVSDIRMKENIVDATGKLEDLKKLNVVNFNYKKDKQEKKLLGFIAQDFEEVFPSLVRTTDMTETGGLEDNKGLKVGMEFAILVKAIQELSAEVETLKQQINS